MGFETGQLDERINNAKEEMRDLIGWAFTHCLSSRSFDYSQVRVQTSAPASAAVPVPNMTLKQARVVRVLRDLAPEQASWLRYAYAGRDALSEYPDIETTAKWLWLNHQSTLGELTQAKQSRLQGFVLPALQQIRHEQNTGERLYTTARLLELTADSVSATQPCWKRDWAPHWRTMCGDLRNLDHVALLTALAKYDLDRKSVNTDNRKTA